MCRRFGSECFGIDSPWLQFDLNWPQIVEFWPHLASNDPFWLLIKSSSMSIWRHLVNRIVSTCKWRHLEIISSILSSFSSNSDNDWPNTKSSENILLDSWSWIHGRWSSVYSEQGRVNFQNRTINTIIVSVKPFKSKNRDKIYLDTPNLKKGYDRDFWATA